MTTLDLLAFGAHPDDVEIGMAGTIIKHASQGYKVGICDLTKAELSSNGTVDIRQTEAEQAAKEMGLKKRLNLGLPDRGLYANEDQIDKVVTVIRKYRPTVIFTPNPIDRHPDHGNCTKIVEEAFFTAGIRRYEDREGLPAYRPNQLLYYFINGYEHPDISVDISNIEDQKMAALKAYKSQFIKEKNGVETPLTNGYIETVQARDRLFGKESGVTCAEGFQLNKPLKLQDFTGVLL